MENMITSRDNDRVKLLRSLLSQKKCREQTGLFVLEGMRLCKDAAGCGRDIHTLYLTPLAVRRYPELLALADKARETLWLDDVLADKIADTKTTQGVFAVLGQLDHTPRAVSLRGDGRYLMLAGLQDPGNLGAVLRAAQALGAAAALCCGCPDLYSPKVLRGTMGALWRMPVAIWHPDEATEMIAHAKQAGLRTVAAALTENALSARKAGLGKGCALLIGNEGSGLPLQLVEACGESVVIPMAGGADSLNAAQAAAILLWEMMGL